jgi:sec-independent protein translocase protein TatB
MFEVGWTEILVIAVVALLVFPTEDLPKLLRTAGQIVGRLRRMAGDFQSQMNTVIREAEREIEAGDSAGPTSLNPLADLKKTLDPIRAIGDDIKRSVTTATALPPLTPAAPLAAEKPAEPEVAAVEAPVAEPVAPTGPALAVEAPKAAESAAPVPAEHKNDGAT